MKRMKQSFLRQVRFRELSRLTSVRLWQRMQSGVCVGLMMDSGGGSTDSGVAMVLEPTGEN